MRPLAVALCLGATTAAAQAPSQEPVDAPTYDWTGPAPAGGTVRLYNGDGDIRVTAATDGQITVHGERMHGDNTVFQALIESDGVTICAFRRGGHCTADGIHGHLHIIIGIHRSPSADLTVAVPAGVQLVVESGDGKIHVAGVSGAVRAHTSDGEIRVENVVGSVWARTADGKVFVSNASGPVEASTADGDVELRLATSDTGRLKAHTGDGTVTVYVPADFAGSVDAHTSDGKIDSEMALPVTGRIDPRHVRATIGTNGAARLEIDTSDGDVHIKTL